MNITNSTSLFSCFDMNNLVYKGPLIGHVADMNYMWSNRWGQEDTTEILGIMTSVVVGVLFLMDFCMYYLIKYYHNRKSVTDFYLLLFNFSNAFIFVILTQFGWTVNCFFVAAFHNSLELIIIGILCRKYFPFLFPRDWFYYATLDFLRILGVLFALPHLVIQDFEVNHYIKLAGAITDIILWFFSIIAVIKYTIQWCLVKFFKYDYSLAPYRHLIFLFNIVTHTTTVVLSFVSCQDKITHITFVLIGTYVMNIVGTVYFITTFIEKFKKTDVTDEDK